MNPVIAFIFFAFALAVPMLLLHPVLLGISFISAVCWLFCLRGRGAAGFLLKLVLPIMLLTAVMNPLFNHAGLTVLFYLKNNPITLEAVLYGLSSALMLGAVVTWFACFNRIFTSDKLIYLTGRLLPSLALLVSMALRFVPLFTRQTKRIALARRGAGMGAESGGAAERVKNALAVFSALMTWALEGSVVTADSMRSRGYGLHPRTSYAAYRFDRQDLMVAAVTFIGIAATVLMAAFRLMHVRYFPSYRINGPSPAFIAFSVLYALVLLLPTLMDLYEAYKWRLLRSKI